MEILIGLVIAMFVITAAYVGYNASQQSFEEAEEHDFSQIEILSEKSEQIQTIPNSGMPESTS